MTKRILITGANRGVGLALVMHMCQANQHIYACCRDPMTAGQLQSFGDSVDNVSVVALDVTSAQSLQQAADGIDDAIDLVICNAGVLNGYGGLSGDENALDQAALQTFSQVLNTNIAGPFFTVKAFLPHLRLSKAPAIAIISSHMGSQQHESANAYAYRASKAGVNNIMVTLKNELISEQIAVAAYHPGWVRTDMGGPSAHLSVQESAQALAARFAELDMTVTGEFINYDGSQLAL